MQVLIDPSCSASSLIYFFRGESDCCISWHQKLLGRDVDVEQLVFLNARDRYLDPHQDGCFFSSSRSGTNEHVMNAQTEVLLYPAFRLEEVLTPV
jgi:hypothetical protein